MPAPKMIAMPPGLKFVPEYNWGGASDAYGSLFGNDKKKKERAQKRAAKLRERAAGIEKKAGVMKKAKAPAKAPAPKQQKTLQKADMQATDTSAASTPDTEGVPQNAEEGASNMRLIIGGPIFLVAAVAATVTVQHQRKKKKAALESAGTTGQTVQEFKG
jgi:hypothetical protein